jgi:hypothetical protein
MPGDQPNNLILATDGTEVSLAREFFLNYGRKKRTEIWNGSGGYYKTSRDKKIFNE